MDIVIKNGKIVDGTGKAAYNADIAVKGGRIINIKKCIHGEAGNVVDASGLVVCPGFIDVHSHNDLVPFMAEDIEGLKLMQGVTTELVGQCGLGVVPCVENENKVWKNYIRGVVGDPEIQWKFRDMNDYMDAITLSGLKNHYAILISHGAVRSSIMNFHHRTPSPAELDRMCKVVADAMEAGAFGMSIGLQYMPAVFSEKDELIALSKVVERFSGIIMVHLRNHDRSIVRAMEEAIAIAETSGVRLHISHMRSYNSADLGCRAEVLIGLVEEAARKGLNITFDEHLYLSGSTLMTQLLPPWLTKQGTDALLEKLNDPDVLYKVKQELDNRETHYKGWDHYSAVAGWDGILITSVKKVENLEYIGKTVGQIVYDIGVHPVDFVAKLLIAEQSGVGIVTLNIFSEEDTVKLIRHPLQMVGSDSIPAGVPHPRLFGNYPLFIGKFVREKKVLSLEEAIYKSTNFPARVLGLRDVGELTLNKKADIVIFDFAEITGYEDYKNPTRPPKGIKHVIVDGKLAVSDGRVCEGKYGKALRFESGTLLKKTT